MTEKLNTPEREAIKLQLASGNSIRRVARITGRSRPTVAKVKKDHHSAIEELQTQLAGDFMELANRLVSSIDEETIKKAPLQARVVSAGIAVDKSRLISGQSTENYAVLHAKAAFEAAESWGDGHRMQESED